MTSTEAAENGKMKRKLYEKELRKLQVELCHVQEWVMLQRPSFMHKLSVHLLPAEFIIQIHELLRWTLHSLGDCLRVAPRVVTKRLKLPTEMMRALTHASVPIKHGAIFGQPRFDLATRPLLPQRDRTPSIKPDDVERVLADINADKGNHAAEVLRHGVLLVFRPHYRKSGRNNSAGRIGKAN